MLEKMSC